VEDVFARVSVIVEDSDSQQSIGTVARLTPDGLCVTAAHVVRDATTGELLPMKAWGAPLQVLHEFDNVDIAFLQGEVIAVSSASTLFAD
jgi:S1-C subfamily serine protease